MKLLRLYVELPSIPTLSSGCMTAKAQPEGWTETAEACARMPSKSLHALERDRPTVISSGAWELRPAKIWPEAGAFDVSSLQVRLLKIEHAQKNEFTDLAESNRTLSSAQRLFSSMQEVDVRIFCPRTKDVPLHGSQLV